MLDKKRTQKNSRSQPVRLTSEWGTGPRTPAWDRLWELLIPEILGILSHEQTVHSECVEEQEEVIDGR